MEASQGKKDQKAKQNRGSTLQEKDKEKEQGKATWLRFL